MHQDLVCEQDHENLQCSAIIALQPGAKLKIKTLQGEIQYVDIPSRQVLVFRGDLEHTGCAYEEKNIRVHAYVAPPGFRVRRD